MKNIYFIAILTIAVIVLAGCGEKIVYKDDDTTIKVDNSDRTVTSTVNTDDGEQTTTVTTTKTGADEWCPEGGEWAMTSTGAQGDMNAEWKIDKLVSSGKYAGLCHVIYTVEGPDGDVSMDYYFSEDGESGYFLMDINGQKIEQEWTG